MHRERASFERRRGSVSLSAAVLSLLIFPAFSAAAGQVRGIAVEQGATGTRAEIRLDGKGAYKTISLHGPERLVVDLPASAAAGGLKLPAGSGIVKSVRTGQPEAGTLRVVFDLAEPVAALKPRMETSADGASLLVIEWPGDGPATSVAAQPATTSLATMPVGPATVDKAAQATAALTSIVTQQAQAPAPANAPAEGQPSPAAATPVAATTGASPQDILDGRSTASTVVPPPKSATQAAVPLGDYIADSQHAKAPAKAVEPAPERIEPQPAADIPKRSGMRPLVVAIDAGHGGQDSGAIGPTGKYEKNVTLAIARELARQVNTTPGLKAYLVRDGDYFIPLNQRAQKARAHKADIFVSIHADAAENRSASGSSVYVLSLKGATSQRARWLADKENASDLIGGYKLQKVDNTLSSVLIDLAQSGHMKASENAAGHVLDGLGRIGNTHKAQLERANFAVLRTSDMPAMLVETAFISNREEERQLTSPAFQRKLAGAVLDGVHTYFTREPPPGTLFAARAQSAEFAVAGGGGSP